MKTLTKEQFQEIVQQIHTKTEYEFNSKYAEVFGVMLDNNLQIQIVPIEQGGDVYDLISDSVSVYEAAKKYDLITVGSCGWAAPNDDTSNKDVPPSQHPDRRRVKLLISVSAKNNFGSSVSFEDDIDNPVFDYGDAIGALAEAINELMNSAREGEK